MTGPFIIDAHLDLALNALQWNRDLTRPIADIRAAEFSLNDKPGRGHGTVCFPEIRRARIRIAVVTQIAKVDYGGDFSPVDVWRSPAQAWAMTQAQLAWYHEMEVAGEIQLICSKADLDKHISDLPNYNALGCILSLEGADSLFTLQHLERAFANGLCAIGPAHYGAGYYAQGTGTTGGFPRRGRELLAEMDRLGMILDVTHLSDECFWEALKIYSGPIWASHHNCRALTPHQRQLADDQIRALIERDAVIGIALDAWMLVPDWVRGQTTPESSGLRLERAVDHIDHIRQIAGNSRHVGLGSDLDGGFGREQTPCDLETIADVRKLPELIRTRGGSEEDARNFANGNFLRFLRRALP